MINNGFYLKTLQIVGVMKLRSIIVRCFFTGIGNRYEFQIDLFHRTQG